MPGVGYLTALAFTAAVDHPERVVLVGTDRGALHGYLRRATEL